MKWVLIAVIVIVIVLVGGTVATITAIEIYRQPIESFYRGAYTMCMVFNAYVARGGGTDFVDCKFIVSAGYEAEWHEQDSPGFEWPPTPVAD